MQEDLEENRIKRIKAENLIKHAEELFTQGKYKAGLKECDKAIKIYFQLGSYFKISDVFIRLSTYIKQETVIYELFELMRKVRLRLRKLNLPEEEAKIMMVMGNLARQIGNFDSAGNFYEDCAELYLEVDSEEYKAASAMFLIRAAEMYQFQKRSYSERVERLLIIAALRLNKRELNVVDEEYKALKLIEEKKYSEAIPIYKNIVDFFTESTENIKELGKDDKFSKEILTFSMSRLIHIIGTYRLVLMICYNLAGDEAESKRVAEESIKLLNSGINLIKNMIKEGKYSRIELKRLTYIGFMRAYFQKYHHIKNKVQSDQIQYYITEGLNPKVVDTIKSLKYYDLCVKTETYSLEDLNEEIFEFDLGSLEKYKFFFKK